MEITGKNIIGGNRSAKGHQTFTANNPTTGLKIVPEFYNATSQEIDEAVDGAKRAYETYRLTSGADKAILLETIADEIVALGEGLISRCVNETGLPEARIISERGRTVGQLKLFASLLREGSWVNARIELADPERKPLPKPDLRSMMRPIGVAGIFGASNFPLAFSVAGGDTASALASGCTVVVKAHPSHPGTSELVGSAIQLAVQKCGMPVGVFSLIQGNTNESGMHLVRHRDISAIGFTGSFRGGKAIFDEANKREVPIPVYAEMGSSNPVFILPNALKEKGQQIAKDLTASVNLGVGQFCTNPGLVFYQITGQEQSFLDSLVENFSAASAGVMLNESIRTNYAAGLNRLSETKKINILSKGTSSGDGYRGVPHLMAASTTDFLNHPQLQEEVFGPSTIAISVSDPDQLLEIARTLHGHLTITVHGTDDDLQQHSRLIAILEQKAGRLIINGYPTGVEVCHSMVHGGPFPATTDSRTTSVGTQAILRFVRPVSYQNFPQYLLPLELRDENPLQIWQLVNGEMKR